MCIKRCCDGCTWAVRLQLKMCRAFIDAAPTAPKDLHAPSTGVSSLNFQLPVLTTLCWWKFQSANYKTQDTTLTRVCWPACSDQSTDIMSGEQGTRRFKHGAFFQVS